MGGVRVEAGVGKWGPQRKLVAPEHQEEVLESHQFLSRTKVPHFLSCNWAASHKSVPRSLPSQDHCELLCSEFHLRLLLLPARPTQHVWHLVYVEMPRLIIIGDSWALESHHSRKFLDHSLSSIIAGPVPFPSFLTYGLGNF